LRRHDFKGMNDQSLERKSEESPEQDQTAEARALEPVVKALDKMSPEELLEKAREFQRQSEKNYDLYLRSQAEMENLKKRVRKEREEYLKFANENLIKEMLPVLDNLGKALSHSDKEDNVHALKEGIRLTLKGLKDTLTKSGLEEVKALGEPFDPCFHEAVSELDDPKAKHGIVLTELQKGFTLNARLIRPAMVVVNRQKARREPDRGRDSDTACVKD